MRLAPRAMAAVVAFGCLVGPASVTLAATNSVLSEAQDGARLRVRPGDTITVRLGSNPSTGFTWRVVAGQPALKLIMQRYDTSPRASRGMLVGAPGVQTFRLRAVGPPGRVVALKLAYNRWWKAMPLARVWSARVVIGR